MYNGDDEMTTRDDNDDDDDICLMAIFQNNLGKPAPER